MIESTPNTPRQRPGSNARLAAIIIGGIVVLALLWIGWDLWNRNQTVRVCADGKRFTIDTRQFDTHYWGYSLQLEASMNDKAKIALKLDPVQQVKLSEAIMSANEFRKYVVAGFNSCAVSQAQYSQYGVRFQALDSLAHQIEELSEKVNLSPAESASLSALINQYSDVAHRLGTD